MLGFAIPHANLHVVKSSGDWQSFTEALAFTIALSGLGWTENGNDYTRYCPTDTSKKGIVGWVFLGTAVPEILIMTLGAVVGTFVLERRDGGRRLPPLRPPARHPVLVRRGVPPLRGGPDLRHQQPRHVLVGRHPPGHRCPGQALPRRAHRLRHRPRHHHVGHLQRLLHRVPVRLRRPGDRVDRALVCHLPGRLGAAAVPLRAERAAEDRPRPRCTGARAASSGRPSSPRWSACTPPSRRST